VIAVCDHQDKGAAASEEEETPPIF
jgi:hypothetical protein